MLAKKFLLGSSGQQISSAATPNVFSGTRRAIPFALEDVAEASLATTITHMKVEIRSNDLMG
jgi:hypothetical protein